jgi:O-antigen ligase
MADQDPDLRLAAGLAGSGMLDRTAFWCALGSAWAAVFSIAVSQILLGAALAALLASRRRWAWPACPVPLAIFLALTVVAWLVHGDLAAGFPQIKKLYVWLLLPLLTTVLTNLSQARLLAAAWAAAGLATALRGFWQFAGKWHAGGAAADAYRGYVGARITGFNSHWMTYSGQLMVVLLAAAALLLLGRPGRALRWLLALCLPLIGVALLLGFTRGVWIATAAALLWLLWQWRPWTVLLVPVLAVAAFLAGPATLRERMVSIVRPHGQTDSNQHRIVTFRTGVAMIRAHPLAGVGLEQVGRTFLSYVPPDVPRPLPEGFYGHLHNIYLQFAAERGIPALLALLAWLGGSMRLWWRALRRLKPEERLRRWALSAGLAILLAILLTGLFEHNLGDSEILALTLSTVAIANLAARGPQTA